MSGSWLGKGRGIMRGKIEGRGHPRRNYQKICVFTIYFSDLKYTGKCVSYLFTSFSSILKTKTWLLLFSPRFYLLPHSGYVLQYLSHSFCYSGSCYFLPGLCSKSLLLLAPWVSHLTSSRIITLRLWSHKSSTTARKSLSAKLSKYLLTTILLSDTQKIIRNCLLPLVNSI